MTLKKTKQTKIIVRIFCVTLHPISKKTADLEYSTTYRQQLKKRIVSTAMMEFTAKGVRAVKMDDIAKKLSISKRTIYELYGNKEQLLYEGVKEHQKIREKQFDKLLSQKLSVMDIILRLYENAINDLKDVTPTFFSDITKYPSVVQLIDSAKQKRRQRTLELLRQGTEEGSFIKDVNFDLILNLSNSMSDIVMQQKLYEKYTMQDIIQSIVFASLRGICTLQGIKMLDEAKKQTHTE